MPFTADAVPHLPAGFGDTFKSRTVEIDGVELHAVVGGTSPALLLLPAWPQFSYGWRLVMPALAEHFTVVAVDMRGMGASAKPATGYDAVTLAGELVDVGGVRGPGGRARRRGAAGHPRTGHRR